MLCVRRRIRTAGWVVWEMHTSVARPHSSTTEALRRSQHSLVHIQTLLHCLYSTGNLTLPIPCHSRIRIHILTLPLDSDHGEHSTNKVNVWPVFTRQAMSMKTRLSTTVGT